MTRKPVSGTPVGSAHMHDHQNAGSVEWYGAVGDGVTDDTAAIKAAIADFGGTSASMGRGTLSFPQEKNYLVTDTLEFKFKSLRVLMHGSRIIWAGPNDRPVIRIRSCQRMILEKPRISGQSGVAGNKATAAISFYDSATDGLRNSFNRIINAHIGPEDGDTLGIQFARGIAFSVEGDDANNDVNVIDNSRIRYCDTGIDIAGTQCIQNSVRSPNFAACGTAMRIRAHTKITNPAFTGSTVTDLDVANSAIVQVENSISENAVRHLVIRNNSHFTERGGYFNAGATITAGGDFIDGTDNASDQTVTLEDWQLTEIGGYSGPTPIISLKGAAAGTAVKVLNLNRVRGITTSFTEANLDVAPAATAGYCVVQGQVYDNTASTYRAFRNVLHRNSATILAPTPDFTRFDPDPGKVNITEVSASNTVADTTIVSFTIPANTLTFGRTYRLRAYGQLTNTSGSSVTFTAKTFVGATLIAGALLTVATGTTGAAWEATGQITFRTPAAAGGVIGGVTFITTANTAVAAPVATVTADATAAITIALAMTMGTAVSTASWKAETGTVILEAA